MVEVDAFNPAEKAPAGAHTCVEEDLADTVEVDAFKPTEKAPAGAYACVEEEPAHDAEWADDKMRRNLPARKTQLG